MKKLTLSVDSEVIADAHRLAKQQGTSVSAMFSQIIRFLGQRDRKRPSLGKLTRQATGLIELPRGKAEREVLADALAEKYGL